MNRKDAKYAKKTEINDGTCILFWFTLKKVFSLRSLCVLCVFAVKMISFFDMPVRSFIFRLVRLRIIGYWYVP